MTLDVRTDEFLAVGNYAVVAAPTSVIPEVEGKTTSILITVRRQ
jgi:hypothetical protein